MAWIPHHLSSTVLRGDSKPTSVRQCVVPQHRHQDAQPAIDDTPQRTAVSMAACPQRSVVRSAGGVVLHTGAPPMVRAAQRSFRLHARRIETSRRLPLALVVGAVPMWARSRS